MSYFLPGHVTMTTSSFSMLKPIFHCDAKTLALGPQRESFAFLDTNRLVSKNAKIGVTPNTNPQREQVEYRLHWVPSFWVLALGMFISCCLCQFHSRLVSNAYPFFSGIWA